MSNQYISSTELPDLPDSDIDIPQSGQLTKHENYEEIIIISDSASESPDEQIVLNQNKNHILITMKQCKYINIINVKHFTLYY